MCVCPIPPLHPASTHACSGVVHPSASSPSVPLSPPSPSLPRLLHHRELPLVEPGVGHGPIHLGFGLRCALARAHAHDWRGGEDLPTSCPTENGRREMAAHTLRAARGAALRLAGPRRGGGPGAARRGGRRSRTSRAACGRRRSAGSRRPAPPPCRRCPRRRFGARRASAESFSVHAMLYGGTVLKLRVV